MLIKCLINGIINEYHTDSLDVLDRIIFPTEDCDWIAVSYKGIAASINSNWIVENHVQNNEAFERKHS